MTYDQLKAIIIATIKPNGNQEITAQMLQDVLVQMTDTERANLGNIPVPTLVSDLENDLGYQTAKEVATLIAQAIEGKADEADIPTKTSQLANDSGFQTSTQVSSAINKAVENKADKSDIPTVPTNVSAFTNDAGYQTKGQVGEAIEEATKDQASQASVSELETKVAGLEGTVASKADKTAIPSKVSQLANDSEYQTSDQVGSAIALAVAPIEQAVAGKADASAVPTKVSQLENDSQYQTKSEVSSAVSGKADKSDVETLGGSVEALGEAVAGKASQVDMTKAQSDIGNVSNLATNQKTLVLAINEVFAAIGSGVTESVVSLKKTDAGYELYQGTALVGEIVFSDDIADGSIVTKMIADGAVTLVKLSASVQASLEKADTAVQPGTLSELVAQLEQAIGEKANISDIPTKVGELENDKGYQTSGQVQSAIANKVDKVSGKGLSTEDFTTELKTELENLLGRENDTNFYGVEWDTTISTTAVTRIGNMDYHRTLPIQSRMRGCLLDDNGEVVEYLPASDWTEATLDGSRGQVMVEIPKHYRKFEAEGTKRRCKISEIEIEGYQLVPKMYISAYEATVHRSTLKLSSVMNASPDYRGGNNDASWDGSYRSLLGVPATTLSRDAFRASARKRNPNTTEWNMLDYNVYKAVVWLYIVEYANLNSQTAFNSSKGTNGFAQGGLGSGVTDVGYDALMGFNIGYPFVPCGFTNELGNNTGVVPFTAYNGDGVAVFSTNVPRYRGIENLFGHLWSFVDGINIIASPTVENGGNNTTKLYVASDPERYDDSNLSGYEFRGAVPRTSGYVKEILLGEHGDIFAATVGASSNTYFADAHTGYHNIPTTEKIYSTRLGGKATSGVDGGLFATYSNTSPVDSDSSGGSRLCFIPKN